MAIKTIFIFLVESSLYNYFNSPYFRFSRIRKKPGNVAILRSFSLNVLRKNNVSNIKGELYENSLDYYKLYSYKHFI